MALSGTLETFSIPDVLRLLANTHKSGRLTLHGDRGTGEVFLDQGAIVAASTCRAGSEDVAGIVFDLLRFRSGDFAFDADESPESPFDAVASVEDTLAAAEALLVEWAEIEAVLPTMDVHVRMVGAVSEDVTVPVDLWPVLVAVGRGSRVDRISERLDASELLVCRDLRALLDRKLIEVADPEPDEVIPEDEPLRAPTFEAPSFADTIGSDAWQPPEPLGPDAVTQDPWDDDTVEEQEAPAAQVDLVPMLEAADAIGTEIETDVDIDHDIDHDIDVPMVGQVDHPGEVDENKVDEDGFDENEADRAEAPSTLLEGGDFAAQLASLSPKSAAAIEALEAADGRASSAGDDQPAPDVSLLASFLPGVGPAPAPLPIDDHVEDVPPPEPVKAGLGGNLLARFLSSTQDD